MRNLKFLSFALLLWVLVIAWCEKANHQEKVSCEGEDVCSIEETVETPSIEIEEAPTVVVETDEEKWNLEWDLDSYEWWEDGIVNDEVADEPMMRKMVVDENATAEEIEQDMINTCENAWWTWADWVCALEDGSTIAF